MGHKVNPIGIRLGITRDWASKWYADTRTFPRYLEASPEEAPHLSWFCSNLSHLGPESTMPRAPACGCARRHSQCRAVATSRCTGIAQTIVRPRSNAGARTCPIGVLGRRQSAYGRAKKVNGKISAGPAGPRNKAPIG